MGMKRKCVFLIAALTSFCIFLQGCASSDVSRETSGQVNTAYQNAAYADYSTSIAEAYQDSSQATKGVIIGGTTGAVAGGFTSGVGILPGAAGGAIFGGAIGAYIDSHTTLNDKLENRGIKTIVLGDQVLIVLPSQRIFNEMTPDINSYAYSDLDLVAQYISRYTNMSVNIAAYTDNVGPASVDRALSQKQAESVEKYLWRRGLNTRMVYAAGYGSTHPITKPDLDFGVSDNYRIEITLEKMPV